MNKNLSDQTKFSVTTPLYYVNDIPHMGSAYTTMVADVIARWQRLKGKSVLMITGTDEHGQKIQRTAEAKGVPPQEHCDKIAQSFENLWQLLNIQYDRFSRTTAPKHHQIVKEFFNKVWDQGDIYLAQQKGWYCVACEEFKEERELVNEGHCSIHTNLKAEWRDEENYFFKLSKYQQQLEDLYDNNREFILPETRRNEVINFVRQGLQDFSVSRINVEWGFPIPVDEKHTIYVWFDALLGYITALLEPEEEASLDKAIACWWPINLHLIGKDILRFHTVYWPAMLMSAGLPLPEKVFGHGFLTKDGKKMGKSLGNVLDPIDLVNRYGADAVRYYFIKEIELGQDGDFSENRFVNILNADLANDLGNLLNRTLGMVQKYCQGKGPGITGENIADDNPLKLIGKGLSDRVNKAYEILKFNLACEEVLSLIRAGNKYIDESAPWSLFKKGQQQEVEQILYAVLESIRLSAYLLSPIIPNLSNDIYQQLGFEVDFNDTRGCKPGINYENQSIWGNFAANENLSKPKPIFAKLENPIDESC